MPRTLRVHWPSVRMTAGSSFGPITISATTPMSRNSIQLISNMKFSPACYPRIARRANADRRGPASGQRAVDLAVGLRAPLRFTGRRLVVDALDRGIGFGAVVAIVRDQTLM